MLFKTSFLGVVSVRFRSVLFVASVLVPKIAFAVPGVGTALAMSLVALGVSSQPCTQHPGAQLALTAFGACSSDGWATVHINQNSNDFADTCARVFMRFQGGAPREFHLPAFPDYTAPIPMACFKGKAAIALMPMAADIDPPGNGFPYDRNPNSTYHFVGSGNQTFHYTSDLLTYLPDLQPDVTAVGDGLAVTTWIPGGSEILFRLDGPKGPGPEQSIPAEFAIASSIELRAWPAAVCVGGNATQCMHFFAAIRNRYDEDAIRAHFRGYAPGKVHQNKLRYRRESSLRSEGQVSVRAKVTIQDEDGNFLERSPDVDLNEDQPFGNFVKPTAREVSRNGNAFRTLVFFQDAPFGGLWAKVVDWTGSEVMVHRAMKIAKNVGSYTVSNVVDGVATISIARTQGFSVRKIRVLKDGSLRMRPKVLPFKDDSWMGYTVPLLLRPEALDQITLVSGSDGTSVSDLGPEPDVVTLSMPKTRNGKPRGLRQ